MVKVGDSIKVFLKGESPWAEVVEVISDKHVRAKIDNDLIVSDLHGLFFGDIADFKWRDLVDGHFGWEHNEKVNPAERTK